MCRRGVLVGSTGRHADVLKIRSPLTFEKQHADLLLEALGQALAEKA
jgi:4-aminobutyrate aminotransferase-like enzyme